jgi:hypothetical protein
MYLIMLGMHENTYIINMHKSVYKVNAKANEHDIKWRCVLYGR